MLDTSVLIALERKSVSADLLVRTRAQEAVGISVITAAELLHGICRADTQSRRMKRAAYVEQVLSQSTLYLFDLAATRTYAELWANLQKHGAQIGAHDVMIAATALSLGFSIATLNVRDYERIDGLIIEQLGENGK
jgi:tRNA(fMet)-specific endonuclease VapC